MGRDEGRRNSDDDLHHQHAAEESSSLFALHTKLFMFGLCVGAVAGGLINLHVLKFTTGFPFVVVAVISFFLGKHPFTCILSLSG